MNVRIEEFKKLISNTDKAYLLENGHDNFNVIIGNKI